MTDMLDRLEALLTETRIQPLFAETRRGVETAENAFDNHGTVDADERAAAFRRVISAGLL